MQRFRHAVIAVISDFALVYALLVFIEYRMLAAHQLPQDHPKFAPDAAWVFALLHTTLIFGIIAVIGVTVAILWSVFDYFRSRRQKDSGAAL